MEGMFVQPLLSAWDGGTSGEAVRKSGGWPTSWSGGAAEARKVGCVALPMAAVSVAQYAVQVASNMMVGHLPGVLPLSASAIATSLASVTGFSLLCTYSVYAFVPLLSPPALTLVVSLFGYHIYSNLCRLHTALPLEADDEFLRLLHG